MTKPTYTIINAQTTGEELNTVIEALQEALYEHTIAASIIGCIGMAILLQAPHTEAEDLPDLIMQASRCICTVLAGYDMPDMETDKGRMN